MIKYIKDILTPIKPHQRLLALVFILLASIITTLGVQLIKEKNSRDVNCEERSKLKDSQIKELYLSQDSLQDLILSTKSEFNQKLIQNSDFYSKKIDSLIDYIKARKTVMMVKVEKKNNMLTYDDIRKIDTSNIMADMICEDTIKPILHKIPTQFTAEDLHIINYLQGLKKNIQSNIQF